MFRSENKETIFTFDLIVTVIVVALSSVGYNLAHPKFASGVWKDRDDPCISPAIKLSDSITNSITV